MTLLSNSSLARLVSTCLFASAVITQAATSPSGRIDYAVGYLPSAGGMIMHGGWGPPNWQPMNETWKLDGWGWTQITASNAPALAHHAMVYDAARQAFIVCGQSSLSSGSAAHTVWKFDGASWLVLTNLPMANSGDVELAYDSARQRVVLYWANDPWVGTGVETWEYDGTRWAKMSPAQSPLQCSDGAAFKYDEAIHRSVLVAATNSTSVQTWLWDGVNWTQAGGLQPTNAVAGSMAYDASRGKMILLTYRLATWAFDGSAWSRLSPEHYPPYTTLGYFTMEYDPSRAAVCFFGGEANLSGFSYPTNLWQWTGSDWVVPQSGVALGVQRLSPGQAVFSWPANAAGAKLEQATSLTLSNWQASAQQPALVGARYCLTNTLPSGNLFYRLRRGE